MATTYWVGATNGAWGTLSNWASSTDGTGGTGTVPVANDTVYINKTHAGEFNVNVNQSIGNIAIAYSQGSSGNWTLAGVNNTTAGTAWALSAPVTIDVGPASANYFEFRNNITASGTAKIVKTGPGAIGTTAITTTTWGTCPIDLNAGALYYGSVNDKLGTGTITMAASTELANSSSPAYTLNNPINVRGDVRWNDLTGFSSVARGLMTLKATVDLDSTTRTLTIGGTGVAANNSVAISGAITGTAGFTKAGAGDLTIVHATNPALNTISGTVTVSGGKGLILGAYNTGGANQLSSVTDFVLSNGVVGRGVEYQGATAYSEDANFTGSSGTVQTSNTGGLTFTGDLSALAGTFGIYNTTSDTTTIWQNTASFPAAVTQLRFLSDANSRTLTMRYSGTGNVSNASGTLFLSPNSGSGVTLTAVMENASTAGATMTFGGPVTSQQTSAIGTVNFQPTVGASAGDMTFSGVISQGSTGTLRVTKAGAGKVVFSGANTYTGATSISAGTLSAQNATALGGTSAGDVTQTGGTLDISGGVALNKAGRAFTLVSNAGANALTTTTGTNTLACAGITLNSTIIVDAAAGASLTVNNTAAMSGAFGVTKNNSGEIGLGTFANTYTGAVTINAGTLTVGNLQNTSTASSLGTGALSSAIALTGTLKYNGTGHSTNRSITFTGAAPALDASGSGAVTYSAATQAAGARTITFTGSSTAANTLSAALSDGTGAVSVAKSGAGKWVLSNATVNYTGTTSVSVGTLNFGSTNRTLSGALSVSGGTIENSTSTLATSGGITMTGGTITAEIASTTAVTVNSGTTARLEPTNSANSYTGATAISTGAVLEVVTDVDPEAPAAGKVLGNSAVTVDGTLTTSANANQRGQMRYGGNLTFNSGAILRIGFAA